MVCAIAHAFQNSVSKEYRYFYVLVHKASLSSPILTIVMRSLEKE